MENEKKMLDTLKYPEYVQAVEDFLAAKPVEGEIVTHEWLDEHLDLEPQKPGYALRKLNRVQGFKKELLTKYHIDLKNILGQGYYVVPAREQTELALKDTREKYARAAREGLARCVHIRTEELTDAQAEANKRAIDLLTGLNNTVTIAMNSQRRKVIASRPVQ